jgi:RNA polymerase sigma-70 factor (sigma-E family)
VTTRQGADDNGPYPVPGVPAGNPDGWLNLSRPGSVKFSMRVPDASVSFEEFVYARSGSLMRTALLLAGQNRAEAEDLLQLALERAYRHWTRACESGEPERYVRKILANASADRWRRLARRPEHALPADQPDPSVSDRTAEVADRDFLLRALAALPPRQRAVLVLRYFDDMSEAEVAEMLGCSLGTVKSHAARALTRLRDAAAAQAAAAQAAPVGRLGGTEND